MLPCRPRYPKKPESYRPKISSWFFLKFSMETPFALKILYYYYTIIFFVLTFEGCFRNLRGIFAKASDSANPKLNKTSSGSASRDCNTESMLTSTCAIKLFLYYILGLIGFNPSLYLFFP